LLDLGPHGWRGHGSGLPGCPAGFTCSRCPSCDTTWGHRFAGGGCAVRGTHPQPPEPTGRPLPEHIRVSRLGVDGHEGARFQSACHELGRVTQPVIPGWPQLAEPARRPLAGAVCCCAHWPARSNSLIPILVAMGTPSVRRAARLAGRRLIVRLAGVCARICGRPVQTCSQSVCNVGTTLWGFGEAAQSAPASPGHSFRTPCAQERMEKYPQQSWLDSVSTPKVYGKFISM
jgi:hypothetical protein